MKKRTMSFCLVLGMMMTVFVPTVGEAATLEEIKIQQQSKQSEMILLDNQINDKLSEVNAKNAELELVEQEMVTLENTVEETGKEIAAQEEIVEERLEQAKDRLKTIQTTEVNQNTVLSLIESESVTDFLNRAYVLMTLQSAGNDQVDMAQEEAEELEALKEEQAAEIAELKEQSQLAQEQKEALNKEVASLQQTMDENKALLDQLDKERATEETRLAEEERLAKEKAEAEKAAAEAEKVNNEKVNNEKVVATQTVSTEKTAPSTTKVAVKEENPVSNKKTEEKPEPAKTETSSSSKTIVVSATGYSTQQAGLSTHTATGIDLRVNSRVIAVDPSVIPLGSKVEIPGYGVFIAGDTGGAIKGNKIDIHFSTVQQALSWGRRTITIKILD
ncbi:cystine transport system substrate-binding protein [Desemzia incerta]|uniref:Cystine transport system substrate-binding protein n=1 Tax=Desemzia incerta TaxID=82801 RepID=A0A1I5UQE1_9LACT|nr:3D domain-containing protein [Desemzia incerta]SFP97481.1 cystine transport system substrate-binding protein [Desemzia incerta]